MPSRWWPVATTSPSTAVGPTIGALSACGGRILVTKSMLGLLEGHQPRFVRRYAELAGAVRAAASAYAGNVRARRLPGPERPYGAGRRP
jgi:3-methyl-2-oxobutanoate hydroxymethyltransferase